MNKCNSFVWEIEDRLNNSFFYAEAADVCPIGSVEFGSLAYPIFKVAMGDEDKRPVLLSGLVHGDEPAGCMAIIKFLLQGVEKYLDDFQFVCFPCVNPSGFATWRRENMDHLDLNRNFFDGATAQETKLIMDYLRAEQFEFAITMDLHECNPNEVNYKEGIMPEDNPNAVWIYEMARENMKRIGVDIISALRCNGVPVCLQTNIYKDKNEDGVVNYPQQGGGNPIYAAGASFDSFLFDNHHTNRAFTFETPSFWDLDRRMGVHIQMIESALQALLK